MSVVTSCALAGIVTVTNCADDVTGTLSLKLNYDDLNENFCICFDCRSPINSAILLIPYICVLNV